MADILLPYGEIYEALGYEFKDKSLIAEALTHSSYSNENRNAKSNERLEFFGDSVLGVLASEYLFFKYRELPEGELTKIRAAAVCEDSLSELSRDIGIGKYLLLGHGEIQGKGRERKSILADAFEAVLAAIYVDGGRSEAERFLYPRLIPKIELCAKNTKDHKSLLQQFVQQTPGEVLSYRLTGEEGPSHDKTFHVEAMLGANVIGKGTGKSKRQAEQEAAKDALILFGVVKS